MIKGFTVTIHSPTAWRVDRYNNRVPDEYEVSQVGNVLVSPGATAELDAGRPDGVSVALMLHFPKTFAGSLEGCLVDLPAPFGGTYRVIGNPKPYMDANCPTAWHMPVEVEVAHG